MYGDADVTWENALQDAPAESARPLWKVSAQLEVDVDAVPEMLPSRGSRLGCSS
jgi:hypothetical protein